MRIDSIKLSAFKSHRNAVFEFGSGINLITGANGSGKTNLLDAIYFLAMTRSAFQSSDALLTHFEESSFFVKGVFRESEVALTITGAFDGNKKLFKSGANDYGKLSEHIGQIPLVLISPYDTDIIRNSSETRRKFFDALGSLVNHEYLMWLIQYNHLVKQRNSLLERNLGKSIDPHLLDAYDEPLIKLNFQIAGFRKSLLEAFLPILMANHDMLGDSGDLVRIHLDTPVVPSFETAFIRQRQADMMRGKTSLGIHKDDYVFELNERQIKKHGSQGQQKTFVLALRLAQYFYLKQKKGNLPILLLDDIFDKLDDQRILKLASILKTGEFGQVFITDARPERSRELLGNDLQEFLLTSNELQPNAYETV